MGFSHSNCNINACTYFFPPGFLFIPDVLLKSDAYSQKYLLCTAIVSMYHSNIFAIVETYSILAYLWTLYKLTVVKKHSINFITD